MHANRHQTCAHPRRHAVYGWKMSKGIFSCCNTGLHSMEIESEQCGTYGVGKIRQSTSFLAKCFHKIAGLKCTSGKDRAAGKVRTSLYSPQMPSHAAFLFEEPRCQPGWILGQHLGSNEKTFPAVKHTRTNACPQHHCEPQNCGCAYACAPALAHAVTPVPAPFSAASSLQE